MSDEKTSGKALKLLGVTEDERLRIENAWLVRETSNRSPTSAERMFVEIIQDEDGQFSLSKGERTLGSPQRIDWLKHRRGSRAGEMKERVMRSKARAPLPPCQPDKTWRASPASACALPLPHAPCAQALTMLGATIDDVRIEKALLVLGEAPGREVPAGAIPRPSHLELPSELLWASPPDSTLTQGRPPIFLAAFLPWGILAPLNVCRPTH